jgi:sulfate adenylyltransferase
MATPKSSPASPDERLFLSGTKVREMLARGEQPPVEFTRPEVAEILMKAYRESD